MEKLSLKATKRTISGRKVKKLRKEGQLPANIYGKKIKSLAIQLSTKEFSEVFNKAGETGIVELVIGSEKRPVLIHNIAYHPVTHLPLHADFFQVDLKEKVTAKVPVVFVGEAPAVKDKVGVLLTLLSEVEVEALPADLIDKLEVDVGKLSAIGESIKVSDLKISDKIKILNDVALEVVKVAPLVSKEAEQLAKEEAEAAAAAAAAEGEQPVPAAETPSQTPPAQPAAAEPKKA